ncbi:MAG: hypothetical protein KKD44_11115 [Proteobacteria bacterium]|nr:hypothetical protein [Pseudomonadota bacterium]
MDPNNQPPKTIFSDTEVLDLCDSIKDIHRILATIGSYLGDLGDLAEPSGPSSNGVKNDFQRWGILYICETFLNKQFQIVNGMPRHSLLLT